MIYGLEFSKGELPESWRLLTGSCSTVCNCVWRSRDAKASLWMMQCEEQLAVFSAKSFLYPVEAPASSVQMPTHSDQLIYSEMLSTFTASNLSLPVVLCMRDWRNMKSSWMFSSKKNLAKMRSWGTRYATPVDSAIWSANFGFPWIWTGSCVKSYDIDLIHSITF